MDRLIQPMNVVRVAHFALYAAFDPRFPRILNTQLKAIMLLLFLYLTPRPLGIDTLVIVLLFIHHEE